MTGTDTPYPIHADHVRALLAADGEAVAVPAWDGSGLRVISTNSPHYRGAYTVFATSGQLADLLQPADYVGGPTNDITSEAAERVAEELEVFGLSAARGSARSMRNPDGHPDAPRPDWDQLPTDAYAAMIFDRCMREHPELVDFIPLLQDRRAEPAPTARPAGDDPAVRIADEAVKRYRVRDCLLNDTEAHDLLMHINGVLSGLRVALCVLMGWDVQQESDKEGAADEFIIGRWKELHPEEWTA